LNHLKNKFEAENQDSEEFRDMVESMLTSKEMSDLIRGINKKLHSAMKVRDNAMRSALNVSSD